jgi:hypothetical protein
MRPTITPIYTYVNIDSVLREAGPYTPGLGGRIERPGAGTLGADNDEVYAELGLSGDELDRLKEDGSDLNRVSRFVRTEAALLLAAFLVAVVGAGALADRYVDPSGELLKRTAAAAAKEGSYRFTTSQKYSGEYAKSARYAAGVRLSGGVDIRSGVTRFDTVIQLPGISAKCTYLTIGDDLYVSVHPSRRNELGATWLRTKANGVLAAATVQGFRPDELDTKAASLFEDLTENGQATVRGVRTTRHTGRVDIAALAGSAADNPMIERSGVGRSLPVEVYIDDEDLLRRITIIITAAKSFSVKFTTDRFDYGKPLDAKAPPAASVKDARAPDVAVACYPTSFPGSAKSP